MTMSDRPNVLLVDDRPENLLALEAVLAPLDCRLVSVTSGEAALRQLLQDDFAVVLLDVQMPDLDGFETAEYIKARRRTRNLPIIFVTAISKESKHVFRGYEAGAVDYVFKPYDAHVLRSKVQVFLDLFRNGQALERSEAVLRATFDCAPIGMARLDRDDNVVDANQSLARTLGRTQGSLAGRSLASLVHRADHALDAERREALRAGTLDRYEVELRLIGADGTPIPCLTSFSVVRTSADDLTGALLVQVQDVRERKRAEAEREALVREQTARREAERVSKRLTAMQRVTDAALSTLELEPLLDELLRRLTDALSVDTAAVVLVEPDRAPTMFQVAAAAGTPAQRTRLDAGGQGILTRLEAADGPVAVRAAGGVVHPLGEAVASLLAVPMRSARGAPGGPARQGGALLVGALFERVFSEEDRALLELAADRAALAIERAQLYEREHGIAQQLQRSLLPERLPAVPALRLSARYLTGGGGAEVGGDWYDAIPLPGGRVLLVMGDIAGRGVEAAATMGQLRSAVRAYALLDPDPAHVASRLNEYVSSLAADAMATIVLALVEADASAMRYVNAGHPPILVATAEGETRFLRRGLGVPVGAVEEPEYTTQEVALEPGTVLVLYTDGLVERRGIDPDVGLRRLDQAVRRHMDREPDDLCDAAMADTIDEKATSDDVTLLVARTASARDRSVILRVSGDREGLTSMRGLMRDWLSAAAADAEEIEAITMAANEACQNAIEHAHGFGEKPVQVQLQRADGEVVVTVRDEGRWKPERRADRGRGFPLMRALMTTVDVEERPEGSTVVLRRRLRGA